MPQPSISYACGRVGTLKRYALRTAQLDRLSAAKDYAEAVKILGDIGFAEAEGTDFQTAADRHVLKACELINAVTPDRAVTDCFLLRYDVHNLKVLFKSRHLAQKPRFLSACGTIPADRLSHAVAEHAYAALPSELKAAMESLEKKTAASFDPMLVDTELDKAMYRQVFANLAQSGNVKTAVRYFRAKVDLQNAIMLLRLKAMGRDAAFFQTVGLEGGNISVTAFASAFGAGERLTKLMRKHGAKVSQAVLDAALEPAKLPFLEKAADDALYELFSPYRYDSASMEILLAYLLQKQREATDVRLIMAGKLNGFKPEAVTERMRELNG
jgi:V/A-type H+/Na+-transporting ATPase subunit C